MLCPLFTGASNRICSWPLALSLCIQGGFCVLGNLGRKGKRCRVSLIAALGYCVRMLSWSQLAGLCSSFRRWRWGCPAGSHKEFLFANELNEKINQSGEPCQFSWVIQVLRGAWLPRLDSVEWAVNKPSKKLSGQVIHTSNGSRFIFYQCKPDIRCFWTALV